MRGLTLASIALLTACSQSHEANRTADQATPPAAGPADPGQPGGLPNDRNLVTEAPIAANSPQGAGQVLQTYFALLEAGKYSDAYRLWSKGGLAPGMTAADFAAGFDQFREYHAEVGAPGRMEGAAGSAYVDFPVQIYGRLKNGERFRQTSTVTLRRANDVPGATAEQLQWRIYGLDLQPPAEAPPPSYRFVGRWATEARNCGSLAWRFTATSLNTPAGSVCGFSKVTRVPGGYDISAQCTAEGPRARDTLKLRFAESAKALLFESNTIADAGLVRCP